MAWSVNQRKSAAIRVISLAPISATRFAVLSLEGGRRFNLAASGEELIQLQVQVQVHND